MRQAVQNVKTRPYSLLGDYYKKGFGSKNEKKYNCQNFVEDARKEYKKLEQQKKIEQ